MDPNDAAILALQAAQGKVDIQFCEAFSPKTPRHSNVPVDNAPPNTNTNTNSGDPNVLADNDNYPGPKTVEEWQSFLADPSTCMEDSVRHMIQECFGNFVHLSTTFQDQTQPDEQEDRRPLLETAASVFEFLVMCNHVGVKEALEQSLHTLFADITRRADRWDRDEIFRGCVIWWECPWVYEPEYMELLMVPLLKMLGLRVSNHQRTVLAGWWGPTTSHGATSTHSSGALERHLNAIQQFISVRLVVSAAALKTEESIFGAARLLGLLYEQEKKLRDAQQPKTLLARNQQRNEEMTAPRQPLRFENDAINEIICSNDHVQIAAEHFNRWRQKRGFSVFRFPFLLDVAAKARLLEFTNIVGHSHLQQMAVRTLNVPYLLLNVRRSNIVNDTLNIILSYDASSYKLPLRVIFDGEEGIDEGGVTKEFFQLMIKELFDPDFGMFIYDLNTRLFWLNMHSFESDSEFALIGILLGLALYNNVILDLHFPLVVYKKLLGVELHQSDLCDIYPELADGFSKLLAFDGDVKETYCRSFTVEHEVFGEIVVEELKEGGKSIELDKDNREEYVELYANYLLEKSVKRQFEAFSGGFRQLLDPDVLELLTAEELEKLVCGSPVFDFDNLKSKARYVDGYSGMEDDVIRWFWEVVDELPLEKKKKLLFFVTGSDRVPIKGLGALEFIISRGGPDSDRLPSAHTCFNVLILPQYDSKEKLKKLLEIALLNSTGFGMI